MSETALYRKYRPRAFADVRGQDDTVRILEAAIKRGAVGHAYVFSGSRGTGKTSVARIFAREIGTSAADILEIDAASNTGVDDVRALNESVNILPFDSKYKVYILDEAHMLSKSAWNALLKTVEEPPAHAVFIFATTEPEKIPETVLSRCQVFGFRKPSQAILKEIIADIAAAEGYALAPGGAELIALLGDGSFRDAEVVLQKVVAAAAGKKISLAEVEAAAGAPKTELVNDFLRAIDRHDLSLGFAAVDGAIRTQRVDPLVYFKLVLGKLRAVILLRNLSNAERDLARDFTETDLAFLRELAARKGSPINSGTLEVLLGYSEMVANAYLPELPLELALARVIGAGKSA